MGARVRRKGLTSAAEARCLSPFTRALRRLRIVPLVLPSAISHGQVNWIARHIDWHWWFVGDDKLFGREAWWAEGGS